MLYNVLLISAIQQHESAVSIVTSCKLFLLGKALVLSLDCYRKAPYQKKKDKRMSFDI